MFEMDGILLFGHESIDIKPWSDEHAIISGLSSLTSLIESINDSGYAQVKVPEDWANQAIDSKDFWGRLEEIFANKIDLLGFVATHLFDGVFNKCTDKNRKHAQAKQDVLENNPNYTDMEYYGVVKLNNEWSNIPPELHVSSSDDLLTFALLYLEKFPYNEIKYISRCKRIFTNLIFHDDIATSLETHGTVSSKSNYGKSPVTGINGFSFAVTKAFHALNSIDVQNRGIKEILDELTATLGYDCTPQGKNKKHLKYDVNVSGEKRNINCEFHIKINNNNRNDETYFQDRIYFGFVQTDNTNKIFVAHSGKHLD